MKYWWLPLLLLASCVLEEEKKTAIVKDSVVQKVSVNTSSGFSDTQTVAPDPQPVKLPSGIYQFYLQRTADSRIEHIVRFNKDLTYTLQERHLRPSGDSTVVTNGTWAPSNGAIWLYKSQVVYARYHWKGDTLQYFNPSSKKRHSLFPQANVLDNEVWKGRQKEGYRLFGIGNEPFWSIEMTGKDSVRFLLSEWEKPVQWLVKEKRVAGDSTIYTAGADSSAITIVVLPHFCNDGMSDYTYPNTIHVKYNSQSYRGCGVTFRPGK